MNTASAETPCGVRPGPEGPGDGAPPPPARGLSAWKLALDGITGVLILICLSMLIAQLIG